MEIQEKRFLFYLPKILPFIFGYFFHVLARIIFSPLSPYLKETFHFTHGEIGSLFLRLSLGFGIALFASPFLTQYLTQKRTIILASFFSSLTFFALAKTENPQIFRHLLFFLGLFNGFYLPQSVSLMAQSSEGKHMGKAFGLVSMFQSAAFILSPFVVTSFSGNDQWRSSLIVMGIALLLLSFLLNFVPKTYNMKPLLSLTFMKKMYLWPTFWISVLFLCIATGLNNGVYNMLPDYFQTEEIAIPVINKTMMLARILGIPIAFLGGYLTDQVGIKRSIAITLLLSGLATISMGFFAAPKSLIASYVCESFLAVSFTPMVHACISKLVKPEENGSIVAMTASIAYLFGSGILPLILGALGDRNLYSQGFLLFGFFILMVGFVFALKNVQERIQFVEETYD